MAEHVEFVRSLLNALVSDARFRRGGIGADAAYYVPGLCLPKGVDALLPLYQRALMHGNVDAREVAATAIGELVDYTSPEALKPSYVKITGPLIRIVADKFPWQVKAAILATLGGIIDKGGVALKPFQPQLQTTFVKALSDPTTAVRARGVAALAKLQALSTRVDPLVNELVAGIAGGAPAGGIQESMAEALASVFALSGDKVSAPLRARALEAALDERLLVGEDDDTMRRLMAKLVGAVLRHAEADMVHATLSTLLFSSERDIATGGGTVDSVADGRAAAVNAVLRFASRSIAAHGAAIAAHLVLAGSPTAHVALKELAASGAGYALSLSMVPSAVATMTAASPGSDADAAAVASAFTAVMPKLVALIARLCSDAALDVRHAAVDGIKRFARSNPRAVVASAAVLLPPLIVTVAKEGGNVVLRAAAERALLHAAQVHGPQSLVTAALAALGADDRSWLRDYSVRLRNQPAESDDDED